MAAKTTKLGLRDPCPCGESGLALADCCFDPIGYRLHRAVPILTPPGPKTGYSHAACYLSGTADCSETISREHYISESVLSQVGQLLEVSGATWLPAGEQTKASVASLTAKILCTRHNSALSPLDTEAGRFLRILDHVLQDLERRTISRRPHIHLVSGETLELWMLKVALGLYFAGVAGKSGQRTKDTHPIDMNRATAALLGNSWEKAAGLYFDGAAGSSFKVGTHLGVATITNENQKMMAGALVELRGMTLSLIFDTRGSVPADFANKAFRPSELAFQQRGRRHSIALTWPQGTPTNSVRMAADLGTLAWNRSAARTPLP